MSTFTNFIIRHEYASLTALGDRLGEVSGLVDWDAFRPLLADLYTNAEGRGGRPNCDVVLMIKLLVLQQWYGLSDPELERQATDRISFRHFLGYPESIPDRSTVWLFRERLAKTGNACVNGGILFPRSGGIIFPTCLHNSIHIIPAGCERRAPVSAVLSG
ncbi:transposase, partial [Methanoculleus sp. FWC-SCC1]